jgi:hypothetical protein
LSANSSIELHDLGMRHVADLEHAHEDPGTTALHVVDEPLADLVRGADEDLAGVEVGRRLRSADAASLEHASERSRGRGAGRHEHLGRQREASLGEVLGCGATASIASCSVSAT